MSAVTRCPKCGTAFRISDAQLAARAGQARCGRCDNVFDAGAAMVVPPVPAKTQPRNPGVSGTLSGARSRPFAQTHPPAAAHTRSAWIWWLGSAVALIALAVQLAFYLRGEIALLWPEVKPSLVRACVELGCEVPLPRRVELMSIEASDLQADGTNPAVMVLSATLRNRAVFPQQFPSLELTLTNAQDEAVARRVLYARDYLGDAVNADTGFAASSETAVKIFIEASALKATGYRLYLFYP
jgi:predicted Zn finger-like uncharacterized protein